MLLAGNYTFRSGTDGRGALKRFMSWAPPAGFVFQSHWAKVDGSGGVFLAEADSAAAIFEATGAFSDLIDFDIIPVIDVMDSVPISLKLYEWADSVG